MNEIYTTNGAHLGDCIYSCVLFYNIKQYIEQNNIIIYFYCQNEHLYQVKDFISSNNIIILSIDDIKPYVKIYNLWIGSSDYTYNWYTQIKDTIIPYDDFFCKFYNNFLNIVNIPIIIDKFIYEDCDLYIRCNDINNKTNNKYKNVDYLINNSKPKSNQFNYDLNDFNNFIIELSKIYNVVTTQKVENIKCTRDDNLTVKDIAAISLNIKNFIAIESGIIAGLYNKYITENKDITFYNLSKYDYHACSFTNFTLKHNINELKFLYNEKWYINIKPTNIYANIDTLLSNNLSLYKEEAIIFLINIGSGFGSNLTVIVQNSLYLKSINPKLHCLGHFSINGVNFKYHESSYNNSFFLYFKYIHNIPINTKYYFVNLHLLNTSFIIPQSIINKNVDDIPINKIYSNYFKENYELNIGNNIIENINKIKKNTNKPLIGIHIRSFAQVFHETKNINNTTENRILKLKNELDKKYIDYNIFIITDVYDYIHIIKNIFNKTSINIYYNEFISRIENHENGELYGYKDSIINLSEYTGIKLGSDILYDCISLINCDYYYTSITNISYITSFINKHNNGLHYM